MDESDKKKKHRAPQAGPKALKKIKTEISTKSQIGKGFSIQHTTKAARRVRKTLDHETKKYHLPNTSATVDTAPPLIVAIVGPPRSGKSTLVRSLIKHFARQLVPVITGPVTVVVGKKYRMSFIECDCNINSMVDIAKVADIVLLTVNTRRGLEMYHFEFINMIQTHGMPRVIPVLNHLDQFKESKTSRAIRKKIKQRLWTDLSAKIFMLSRFITKKVYGARPNPTESKEIEGDYLPAEIQRLARMMIVKTPRPSDWRTGHPYLLIDRIEDITNPRLLSENPKTPRSLSFYGWVRGAAIEASFSNPLMHVAGLGDYSVIECSRQPDPCPTPAQIIEGSSSIKEAIETKMRKRFSEGERKIYAPMSSVGGVLFDRDATYIDLGGSHHLGGGRLTSGRVRVVGANEVELTKARELLSEPHNLGLDERMQQEHKIRITADAPFIRGAENVATIKNIYLEAQEQHDSALDSDSSSSSSSSSDDDDGEEGTGKAVRMFKETSFPEFMSVDEDENEAVEAVKPNVSEHQSLKLAFDNLEWQESAASRVNWKQLIYNPTVKETQADQLVAGGMLRVSATVQASNDDVTLAKILASAQNDWSQPSKLSCIANAFTTGEWNAEEDAERLLAADAKAIAELAKSRAESLAKAAGSRTKYRPDKKEEKADSEDESVHEEEEEEFHLSDDDAEGGSEKDKEMKESEEEVDETAGFEKSLLRPTKRQKILEKRARHKELFDRLYDSAQRGSTTGEGETATAFYDKLVDKQEAQRTLNRKVLAKMPPNICESIEGAPPGAYVRLKIAGVPSEFMENFDPRQPLVVGGLVKGEESMGFIQARFQAHRWLKRVLKSNDPITVSLGWRRFQTIAVYSKEEHNLRQRYLKYALAHEHCHITFNGPIVPAKTGVIAFVNSAWRDQMDETVMKAPKFRIAGTGSVTDFNESFQIMKKLKLVGHPFKIFSKTAFIRGMFNTELEVSRMIGSKVQTVSKVRGLIKSALTNSTFKPGDFRATFEAPIRMADLVFVRTFVPVQLPAFYNPILNLLLDRSNTTGSAGSQWRMLKTVGELRFLAGQQVEMKEDSVYKPVERAPFVKAPLTIPSKLVAALPFADKPKMNKKQLRAHKFFQDDVRAARREGIPARVAAIRDAEEDESGSPAIPDPVGHARDRKQLLQRLRDLHAAFSQKQHDKMVVRTTEYKAKREKAFKESLARQKANRKKYFSHYANKHRGNPHNQR